MPQIAKCVLPELIVSEKMSIFTKKIQISFISLMKKSSSKLPFELLNIIEPCLGVVISMTGIGVEDIWMGVETK